MLEWGKWNLVNPKNWDCKKNLIIVYCKKNIPKPFQKQKNDFKTELIFFNQLFLGIYNDSKIPSEFWVVKMFHGIWVLILCGESISKSLEMTYKCYFKKGVFPNELKSLHCLGHKKA